jgi:hypothetical protein
MTYEEALKVKASPRAAREMQRCSTVRRGAL